MLFFIYCSLKGEEMNKYTQAVLDYSLEPKFCFINRDKLNEVAAEFSRKSITPPDWRLPMFPLDDETFVEFIGVGNAINFSYTNLSTHRKFTIEYPVGSDTFFKSSDAMWASLLRSIEDGADILNPGFLENLTMQHMLHIFRHAQPRNPNFIADSLPMLEARLECLRNIPVIFNIAGVASFKELFEKSDYHAFEHGGNLGVVDRLLVSSSEFFDAAVVDGKHLLPFQKRAQLLPLMYQGRALSSKGSLPLIQDVSEIGPISDYQVPNALRELEILEYCEHLSDILDKRVELLSGSEEEIEIRVQTVHALCALLEEINAFKKATHRKQITMVELDFLIWKAGRASDFPHHIIMTTDY